MPPAPHIFGSPATKPSKKPHAKDLSITSTKIDLIITTEFFYGRAIIIPKLKLETCAGDKVRSLKQDKFMAFQINHKTITGKGLM